MKSTLLILATLASGLALARADVLLLKSGDRVEGDVLREDDQTVEIRLRDSGETRTYRRDLLSGMMKTGAAPSAPPTTRPALAPLILSGNKTSSAPAAVSSAASATNRPPAKLDLSKPNPFQGLDPQAKLESARARLESRDPVTRANAARALGALGAQALPAVRDLIRHVLDNADPLEELTTINGVPGKGRPCSVAEFARNAIVAIGPGAVAPLVDQMGRERELMARVVHAELLGRIKDRAATPALLRATKDPEPPVRLAAVMSLGQIRDPAALPELMSFVRSGGELSLSAIESVEAIGDTSMVAPLFQVLAGAGKEQRIRIRHAVFILVRPEHVPELVNGLASTNAWVRATAAEAAAKTPHPTLAPVLIQAIAKDPETEVRQLAVLGLGHYHDGSPLGPLLAALKTEKETAVRSQTVRTLRSLALNSIGERKQLRDLNAIDALAPVLAGDPVAEVRAGAADVIGKSEEPRGLAPLTAALKSDRSSEVRASAARALGNLHDPAAMPALEAATKDPQSEVRTEANDALRLLRAAARRAVPSGRSRQ